MYIFLDKNGFKINKRLIYIKNFMIYIKNNFTLDSAI